MISSKFQITKKSIENIEEFLDTIIDKIELPTSEKLDFKEENKTNLIASIQELMSNGHKEKEAVKIAIDRFGDFNDLHNETIKFNTKIKTLSKFKNISLLTYILLFGSIRGAFVDKESIKFYLILSLMGGVLLVIKNNSITNKKYKNIIKICDISILIILTMFYKFFHSSLRIRDLTAMLIIILYFYMYFKLLFDRKLY